jgi:hypothetical protein
MTGSSLTSLVTFSKSPRWLSSSNSHKRFNGPFIVELPEVSQPSDHHLNALLRLLKLLKERITSTVLILLSVLSPPIPPSSRLEGSSLRRYCCSYRAQRSFLLRRSLGIRKHSCSCGPRFPTLERSRSYLLPPRLNLRHSHCRRLPLGHLWTRYLRRGQAQQAIRGR